MADPTDDDVKLYDALDVQFETKGVGVITTHDGSSFMFSTKILETLLERSRKSGRAIVFVARPKAVDKN